MNESKQSDQCVEKMQVLDTPYKKIKTVVIPFVFSNNTIHYKASYLTYCSEPIIPTAKGLLATCSCLGYVFVF
jgi:hypothetical protein